MDKKIYAIIPARSGSKGVKDKNLLEILNHSLLDWSISAALKCPSIERVFVSTDSRKYADIAISCGAEAPFLRPKEYSLDNSSDIEFVTHALDQFKKNNEEPDLLVHLRPTTPLRDPGMIEQAISMVLNSKNSTSLRSVHEMPESSYKTLEIDNKGMLTPLRLLSNQKLDINAPRQIFPTTFQANGYVDILLSSTIRQTKQMHGNNIFAFKTNVTTEIDCLDDFNYIKYQALSSKDIYKKIFN